jgi:hypothetical protein
VLFPLFRARQNGAKSEDFLPKSRHKFTRAKQIQQSFTMARNQEKANVRLFTIIKCCLLFVLPVFGAFAPLVVCV